MVTACSRVIDSPADELSLYRWRGEYENGNSAELYFDGDNGYLSLRGEDIDLDLSGLYVVTDDSLIICDDRSGVHYNFAYRLHGDRIELFSNDGSVVLAKVSAP